MDLKLLTELKPLAPTVDPKPSGSLTTPMGLPKLTTSILS